MKRLRCNVDFNLTDLRLTFWKILFAFRSANGNHGSDHQYRCHSFSSRRYSLSLMSCCVWKINKYSVRLGFMIDSTIVTIMVVWLSIKGSVACVLFAKDLRYLNQWPEKILELDNNSFTYTCNIKFCLQVSFWTFLWVDFSRSLTMVLFLLVFFVSYVCSMYYLYYFYASIIIAQALYKDSLDIAHILILSLLYSNVN